MFAEWMVENRNCRDLTPEGLAKKARISYACVAHLEDGDIPSREMVDLLSQAFASFDPDPDCAFEIYRELLKSGLLAAGLVSESDLGYFEPEEDVIEIWEGNPHFSELQKADLRRDHHQFVQGIVQKERKAQKSKLSRN